MTTTYTLDREDLLGEINVVHRLIGDAIEYLDAGDPAAARMVLQTWVDHGDGHPEIGPREAYECRVCQAPETKRLRAKMDDAERYRTGVPRGGRSAEDAETE